MSLARYRQMFEEADSSLDYWCESTITEFAMDLASRMETFKITRSELARRLRTSQAYITKILGGNANFTLATMVKIAMALDGTLHVHIADRDVITQWHDEYPTSHVVFESQTADVGSPLELTINSAVESSQIITSPSWAA